MTLKSFISAAFLVFFSLMTASCFKTVQPVGYTFDETLLDKIIPGESRRSVVEQFLGSPSSKSDFGTETWYYISRNYSVQAFLKPKLVKQRIVAIEFDHEVVSAIHKYNTEDAKNIRFATEVTPAEGHDVGIAGQLLGNVGRFNSKGRKGPGEP